VVKSPKCANKYQLLDLCVQLSVYSVRGSQYQKVVYSPLREIVDCCTILTTFHKPFCMS